MAIRWNSRDRLYDFVRASYVPQSEWSPERAADEARRQADEASQRGGVERFVGYVECALTLSDRLRLVTIAHETKHDEVRTWALDTLLRASAPPIGVGGAELAKP